MNHISLFLIIIFFYINQKNMVSQNDTRKYKKLNLPAPSPDPDQKS